MSYVDFRSTRGFPGRISSTEAVPKGIAPDGGLYIDPHTAVAFSVADAFVGETPIVVLSTASPYKFPAAVLNALRHDAGEDGFAAMDALHAPTAVPVPKNPAALREKPVLHSDVRCDPA